MQVLTPMKDRVLIRKSKENGKTTGGLIVSEKVDMPISSGEIVAVGPGFIDKHGCAHALPVKAGDKVMVNKHAGGPLQINGETLHMIQFRDILALSDK